MRNPETKTFTSGCLISWPHDRNSPHHVICLLTAQGRKRAVARRLIDQQLTATAGVPYYRANFSRNCFLNLRQQNRPLEIRGRRLRRLAGAVLYQLLRSSRNFRNTVRASGMSPISGKSSCSRAITDGLSRRKNVFISCSCASVVTSASAGSWS